MLASLRSDDKVAKEENLLPKKVEDPVGIFATINPHPRGRILIWIGSPSLNFAPRPFCFYCHAPITFSTKKVQYTLGKGDAKEHIQQLKDHVGGFKNILSKTASEHHAAADDLHQKAKGGGGGGKADHHSNLAQKMLETNKGLHEKLASQNSTTKWFIVFLFGAIIAVGVAFYQKMRHYEKKHFM